MLKKIEISIIYLLFCILPFHALFITFTNQYLNINYLHIWKEFLIFILFIILVYKIFKKQINLHFIDKIIIAYILYMVLYSMFLSTPILNIIIGLKYDVLFLIFFLITSHILVDKYTQILNILLYISIPIVLFGFIFYFILPIQWLTYLGYSTNISAWIPMKDALPIFHGIGDALNIMRVQSTFASPNYYALYLIIIMWVSIAILSAKNISVYKYIRHWQFYYIIFILFNLVLTFSRSAIIALLISLIAYIYINYKDKLLKKLLYTFYLISISLILFLLFIFTHSNVRISSTSGHIEAMYRGIQDFLMYPLGYGLGYAGPASRYVDPDPYRHGFIVENWFLQISLEGGLIALILFIIICANILYINFKFGYNKLLIYPFIASLVMAMFLHIYEDSSTSLLLFGLLGLNISGIKYLNKYKT